MSRVANMDWKIIIICQQVVRKGNDDKGHWEQQ